MQGMYPVVSSPSRTGTCSTYRQELGLGEGPGTASGMEWGAEWTVACCGGEWSHVGPCVSA